MTISPAFVSAHAAGDGNARRMPKSIFEETDVMDERTQFWMRSCLLGTCTAGLLVPGLLSGQTSKRSGAIQQAGYDSASGDMLLSESEVEQRLRELYERDGREMPNLRMSTAPAAPQPAATSNVTVPGQNGAPRPLPTQARFSTVPASQPTGRTPSRVTSFFKRLIPGENRTQPQPQPAPVRQPQPIAQPAPAYAPRQIAPAPQAPQAQLAPVGRPAVNAAPTHAPASQPATIAPATQAIAQPATQAPADELRAASEFDGEEEEFFPAEEEPTAFPAPTADEDEEEDEEMFAEPEAGAAEDAMDDSTPEDSALPKLDDEFPNPFADENENTEPEAPAEEANPYSGMTLEDADAPAELPEEPAIGQEIPAEDPTVDDSTASKMRRIIQRTDMKGLKGFCPVTLRDQRALADSRPEFVATYRGQKFYFASQDAQAKFEADAARYAPAAYGADVVVLTDAQDVVEGTLDHAAWFKGRLYLFGSQESHDKFVESPEKYASPPGIE
jgi:YHS domain-containing protein